MIQEGYALKRISDNTELLWWAQIPTRIDIPGEQIVLFSAQSDWTEGDYEIVPQTKEIVDVPPEPRLVQKKDIVDRLYGLNKLTAAKAALDGSDLYTQERWNSRSSIYADDPTALALLNSIGADPVVVLA